MESIIYFSIEDSILEIPEAYIPKESSLYSLIHFNEVNRTEKGEIIILDHNLEHFRIFLNYLKNASLPPNEKIENLIVLLDKYLIFRFLTCDYPIEFIR